VINSSEVFKCLFSYALLKMDRFLLNSNKRCDSQNKKGTSSTSGKSVKKCKIENMMAAIWTLVSRRQKSMAKRGRNAFCV
jgi:23S rRNA maturation mini-RNase III